MSNTEKHGRSPSFFSQLFTTPNDKEKLRKSKSPQQRNTTTAVSKSLDDVVLQLEQENEQLKKELAQHTTHGQLGYDLERNKEVLD